METTNREDQDARLAAAFDGQAARFERAPVQTDPGALARLVAFADFPPDSRICDVGSGPGLVSLALLQAGHRVDGIDLSSEMVTRARSRCAGFGDRGRFEQGSIDSKATPAAYDGTISRYVLHHVDDPLTFLTNQLRLIRPGGLLVLSDHTTDPHPDRAADHTELETLRDHSHTRNLTLGGIVDLCARVGLESIHAVEEPFTLDFDEWFDRGTPTKSKAEVRDRLVALPPSRGFRVESIVARWPLDDPLLAGDRAWGCPGFGVTVAR